MTLAWSFPTWTCRGCKNEVEWADARALVDDSGRLYGFTHVDCENPDD